MQSLINNRRRPIACFVLLIGGMLIARSLLSPLASGADVTRADDAPADGAPQNDRRDVLNSADLRFIGKTTEVPHFQRHVLPLFRKLGCSGRNCHGSASGQGGFRLSLFGYDFEVDHQTLREGDHPRVDVDRPEASLILLKPTMQIDHGGGERFAKDGWKYEVIKKWIVAGALPVDPDDPQFEDLQIEPAEIFGSSPGRTHSVRVTCSWSDQTREDVTPLCHYEILDESVASVDEQGVVTVRGPGDTHLIAFYDNGIASMPVTIPFIAVTDEDYPAEDSPTAIDKLISQKLQKLGIAPSELCTDAEFLRRVSLDITGSLPPPDAVRTFLKDESPDKRSRKIDELLASPGYASYWAYKLSELWGSKSLDLREQFARPSQLYHWYRWTQDRLERNVPYDRIVEGMVVSQGRLPGENYDGYMRRMGEIYRDDSNYEPAENETLPYFWYRQLTYKPEDAAMAFSHAFLGVRLQCAQCHKHPFDIWTNADFLHFASYFSRIKHDYLPDDKETATTMRVALKSVHAREQVRMVRGGKTFPFKELVITPPLNKKLEENRQSPKYVAQQLPIVKRQLAEARRLGNKTKIKRAEEQLQKFNRARLLELEALIEKTARAVKKDHPVLLNYQAKAHALRRELQGLQTTKILDGFPADPEAVDDPREILMSWLRSPDNRYFVRIFVNRVWAGYFGRGIIEPVDDLNLANPPVNAPLLDYLTESFVERGYDIKWLHREIANSRAYQRSWRPNETNGSDERNFSRALPRRLPAEVFETALARVFAAESDEATAADGDEMTSGFQLRRIDFYERLRPNNDLLKIFGRPVGKPDLCDCARSNEPALVQTLFTQNDAVIDRLIDKGDWLNDVDRRQTARTLDDWIENAYLRTLSRFPENDELTECRSHLSEADSLKTGLQDLMWALVNSKEFRLNH
ncbi:MAG: DUF1549 and DUF1553 domain-containing protein [Planctomycetaceae bacterium]